MYNKQLRVLIVEDSADDTRLLVRYLSKEGYEVRYERVETAGTMSGALDRQEWDVVLADYNLPIFSAPAALLLLQQKAKDIPFIVLSSAIGEESAVAVMRAGAHDFFMKGNLIRLGAAIEREVQAAADRREHQRIDELAARLGRIVDQSANEIYVFEAESWRLIQANRCALQNLGYTIEELTLLTPLDLQPNSSAVEYAALLAPLHTGEQEQVLFETVKRRHDGSVYPAEVHLQLFRDERPPVFVAFERDISERERAHEELRQANTAKDRLLAVLAHELRNPMAGLKGIPSLLRRRLAAGRPLGDIVDMTSMMEKEVDRVSSLLDEVLEAFRSQQGRLVLKGERINLVNVVILALRPYQTASEQHHFTLRRVNEDPIWVWGDARRLEDVVRNLLSNALKYSPSGGNVTIALQAESDRAMLSVQDEGLGVPVDQLSEIFERFYRASNVTSYEIGGLGLGLYTCRDIIRRHHGRIWAENKEEAGASFFVELPLHAANSADLEGSAWPES